MILSRSLILEIPMLWSLPTFRVSNPSPSSLNMIINLLSGERIRVPAGMASPMYIFPDLI